MRVFELTLAKAPLIAELMARLVPEWWGDYNSTLKMITAPDKIGWYMGENAETPKGFLYIKEYECYSCAEIENYGYDDNGMFAAREKIAVLYDKAEQFIYNRRWILWSKWQDRKEVQRQTIRDRRQKR